MYVQIVEKNLALQKEAGKNGKKKWNKKSNKMAKISPKDNSSYKKHK